MTVKCINTRSQEVIVHAFLNGSDIAALSELYGKSRRTIIRVIEDAGIDPGIKRRNSKPKGTTAPQKALPGIPNLPKYPTNGLPRFHEPLAIATVPGYLIIKQPKSWSTRAKNFLYRALKNMRVQVL